MIGVVVAALETGAVAVADRAAGPLRLAVVVPPFVTANKWTHNTMRDVVTTQATHSDGNIIRTYLHSTCHKIRTQRNILLQA